MNKKKNIKIWSGVASILLIFSAILVMSPQAVACKKIVYQENANELTPMWDFTIDPSTVDGDWSTYGYAHWMFNYTKIAHSTGAILEFKTDVGRTKVLVPQRCWDYHPTKIIFYAYSSDESGLAIWCMSANGWEQLNFTDSYSNLFYEEGIWWTLYKTYKYAENASSNQLPAFAKNGIWNDNDRLPFNNTYLISYKKPVDSHNAIWVIQDVYLDSRQIPIPSSVWKYNSHYIYLKITTGSDHINYYGKRTGGKWSLLAQSPLNELHWFAEEGMWFFS